MQWLVSSAHNALRKYDSMFQYSFLVPDLTELLKQYCNCFNGVYSMGNIERKLISQTGFPLLWSCAIRCGNFIIGGYFDLVSFVRLTLLMEYV